MPFLAVSPSPPRSTSSSSFLPPASPPSPTSSYLPLPLPRRDRTPPRERNGAEGCHHSSMDAATPLHPSTPSHPSPVPLYPPATRGRVTHAVPVTRVQCCALLHRCVLPRVLLLRTPRLQPPLLHHPLLLPPHHSSSSSTLSPPLIPLSVSKALLPLSRTASPSLPLPSSPLLLFSHPSFRLQHISPLHLIRLSLLLLPSLLLSSIHCKC